MNILDIREKGGFSMFKYVDCIDAGTEYCPCSLAERGECIICCQLRDKNVCDCLNWKGSCICQEFLANNKKSKKNRQYRTCNIISKKQIRKDLFILNIQVTGRLARELDTFGSFVFLKKPGDFEAYSTPISILNTDTANNIITVAVKIDGAKSKAINECNDEIMVKGPYWNGIQGEKYVRELKSSRCLILARGVAAAPVVLAAKKLIQSKNEVYVLLEKGRSGENFTKKDLLSLGCNVLDISFIDKHGELSPEAKSNIEKLIEEKNFNVVLSAGSDDFHKKAINYIHGIKSDINFSTVNNSIMCCGEGVCGSCMIYTRNGQKIKSCKQQYNPLEIFSGGDD